METQQVAARKHPLAERQIGYITSWTEWKKRWEKETDAEYLDSLLFRGFGVSVGRDEAVERLCLYLEIADKGDGFLRTFQNSSDKEFYQYRYAFGIEVKNAADLRIALSQKAFQMLCQNFFKNTVKRDWDLPSWTDMIFLPQVLNKLFRFFRLDERGEILNLYHYIPDDSEHQKQVARDFAHDFCLFVWDCGEGAYPHHREITREARAAFRQVRPDIVTLLCGLDKLDLLLRRNRYAGLDDKCMKKLEKKLEELALGYNLDLPNAETGGTYGNKSRKPQTIEEACFGGSQAARVLLVLRTIKAQEKHFEALREANKQRQEAEQKLRKLQRS